MKKYAALLVAVAASGFCNYAQAGEISYPKQTFDASYDMTGPTGNSKMRIASDGKGHVRTETDGATGKVISLQDYLGKKITTAMEKQKMIMTMAMKPADKNIYDAQSAKAAGAKDLGAKNIDGHPCHGFEVSKDKITTQEWIGDDTHYLVHSETTMPQGKQVMSLKKWSGTAPGDITQLPTGYKELKMPGQ